MEGGQERSVLHLVQDFYFLKFFSNFILFKFSYLTYSAVLVSQVEVSDSSVVYNTQCPPLRSSPSHPIP